MQKGCVAELAGPSAGAGQWVAPLFDPETRTLATNCKGGFYVLSGAALDLPLQPLPGYQNPAPIIGEYHRASLMLALKRSASQADPDAVRAQLDRMEAAFCPAELQAVEPQPDAAADGPTTGVDGGADAGVAASAEARPSLWRFLASLPARGRSRR